MSAVLSIADIERIRSISTWRDLDFWGTRWLLLNAFFVRCGRSRGQPMDGGIGFLHAETIGFARTLGAILAASGAATKAPPDRTGPWVVMAGRDFDPDFIGPIEECFPGCEWRVFTGHVPVPGVADCIAYAYSQGEIVAAVAARAGFS